MNRRNISRRELMKKGTLAACGVASSTLLPCHLSAIPQAENAQTPTVVQAPALIKVDLDRRIGRINPNIYGNFTEHLGRCIYGGIYEEGSPLA